MSKDFLILDANPRRSKSQQTAEALTGLMKQGIGMYGEHQKKKRLGDALSGVESIYADPNLSQEQKFIKSFSSLKEFPEVSDKFAGGLSKFSESPLQRAQRLKLEQELSEMRGDEDDYRRMTRGDQPQGAPETVPDEEAEEPAGKGVPKRERVAKYNVDDPKTWSDEDINKFRSYKGAHVGKKSLANRAENEFERRKEGKKKSEKYQKDIAPLEGALEIIGEMKKLGEKGNLGIGTSLRSIYSSEARKDAGEYERLGKSLISFASNIPIRNQREFDALAHDLYDPSISDAKRSGILAAMEKIIQNSMKSFTPPEEEGEPQARKSGQKERRPLTIFVE